MDKIKTAIRKISIPLRLKYRQLVGGNRMEPSFIIVGAQKAGTTSLYKYLVQHSAIKSTLLKEVHYFDLNYDRPLSWYQSFFPLKNKEDTITGEASPYYMFHPLALKRIANLNPDIKIIVMLRDPVSRAISHYYHEVRLGREKLTMREAFDEENSRLQGELDKFKNDSNYISSNHQRYSYKSRGLYLSQIEEIIKYFKEDNIKIIDSNEFFKQTKHVVKDVLNFLNKDSSFDIKTEKRFNSWKKIKDSEEEKIRIELKTFYKNPNKELFTLIGKKFDWD